MGLFTPISRRSEPTSVLAIAPFFMRSPESDGSSLPGLRHSGCLSLCCFIYGQAAFGFCLGGHDAFIRRLIGAARGKPLRFSSQISPSLACCDFHLLVHRYRPRNGSLWREILFSRELALDLNFMSGSSNMPYWRGVKMNKCNLFLFAVVVGAMPVSSWVSADAGAGRFLLFAIPPILCALLTVFVGPTLHSAMAVERA